jgi:hypothetical protein
MNELNNQSQIAERRVLHFACCRDTGRLALCIVLVPDTYSYCKSLTAGASTYYSALVLAVDDGDLVVVNEQKELVLGSGKLI